MKAAPTNNEGANIRRQRRAPTRQTAGRVARCASKAIVRLNTQSIRKKALQAHRKAERALEKLAAELKRYHERDVPGFRSWIHRSFGDLLTRQRECQQAIEEKMAFAGEVKEMVGRYGLSYPEAYLKVVWRRAHPEAAEDEDRKEAEAQRQHEQAHPEERPDDESEWDDDLDDDDDFTDDELDQLLEDMLEHSRKPQDAGDSHPDHQTAKDLYRNIVRLLHPDHHGQLSEARATLWHEAQAAYRRHDLSALHSILARCEDGVSTLGDHTPVSLILRMTRQLVEAARANRHQLQGAKQDVAWRYEDRLDDRKFIRTVERDLLDLLNRAQGMLAEIKRDLADLEREANRQQQRNSRPQQKPRRPSPHRHARYYDDQDDLPF